jgi:hypothetical protein
LLAPDSILLPVKQTLGLSTMHIQLRRWHMVVIAVLSILTASSSILWPMPTFPGFSLIIALLLNSIRAAIRNPEFAVKLSEHFLLLFSGAALLFDKPWSRFGYLAVATLFTAQALVLAYGLMTIPDASKGTVPYVPSLLIGLVVAVAIYWAITALVFSYFRGTKDLTVRSTTDAKLPPK